MENTEHPRSEFLVGVLLIAFAVGTSLWLRWDIPVNHDVNWFLVAADRMMGGGSFTRDVFEVNMPLATAIYVPALLVSRLFSIGAAPGVLVWTYFCFALCISLTWRLLPSAPRRYAGWAMAWIACLLVIFPAYEFAEREHFAVLLCLPFVALCSNPYQEIRLPVRFLVVTLAAIGAFIKPHYAILPFVILLPRLVQLGIRHTLLRADVVVLAGAGLLYGSAVLCLFPEWFESARWTLDLYPYFRGDDPARFLSSESALISLMTFGLLLVLAVVRPDLRQVSLPFILAATYAWVMFVLQGKGWRYHLLPAGLFSAAGLAAVWPHLFQPFTSKMRPVLLQMVTALLACTVLLHSIDVNRQAPKLSNLRRSSIGEALSITSPGDTIFVFSTSGVPYFPAVLHLELKWASRYMSLWPLSFLGRPDATLDAERIALKRKYTPLFIASVVDDLHRWRPDVALVDLRPDQFGLPGHFDFLEFFLQSPDFAREWSNYQKIGQSGEVAIYVRKMID